VLLVCGVCLPPVEVALRLRVTKLLLKVGELRAEVALLIVELGDGCRHGLLTLDGSSKLLSGALEVLLCLLEGLLELRSLSMLRREVLLQLRPKSHRVGELLRHTVQVGVGGTKLLGGCVTLVAQLLLVGITHDLHLPLRSLTLVLELPLGRVLEKTEVLLSALFNVLELLLCRVLEHSEVLLSHLSELLELLLCILPRNVLIR